MFSKTIIDSDYFLDMPLSAQSLYFHLGMRADDDGFVNNPKKIQRMIGASDDDMRILAAKQFIIRFESGVILIRHWKIHNYLRPDRYVPTLCVTEKSKVALDDSKAYTIPFGIPDDIPTVYQMDTKGIPDDIPTVDAGKDSIGKDSIGKVKEEESAAEAAESAPSGKEKNEAARRIIGYLNEKTGKHFRDGEKTVRLIKARMKEGFAEDDFRTVIDNRVSQWSHDAKMAEYLRPETLFGTKFESYLNAVSVPQMASLGVGKGDSETESSFDMDDLMEAAMMRSYGKIV